MMNNSSKTRRRRWSRKAARMRRKGVIAVLAAITLIAVFAFVAFAVDTNRITLTKTNMQSAADAAAVAAANKVGGAARKGGVFCETAARPRAFYPSNANGIYIDKQNDVEFGKRTLDPTTGGWTTLWGVEPYNSVKVTTSRDNTDLTQPDGQLQLSFGWAVGKTSVALDAEAVAFVEARDLVMVLDFSSSMTDDSEFRSLNRLAQSAIESNMSDIYQALGPPSAGTLSFQPQWLTVTKEQGGNQASVTFKVPGVSVSATAPYSQMRMQFANGGTQTISGLNTQSGDYQGSGSNASSDVTSVWITFAGGAQNVTLTGAAPTSNHEPQIHVTFQGSTSVFVQSSKDLSNVVLEFDDGSRYKFDGLSNPTGTFSGFGSNAGKTITTVWVKSGRNHSGDGPGYGERFNSPASSGGAGATLRFDDSNTNVKAAFGLTGVSYPYPSGSWDDLINYCRTDNDVNSAGYRKMYGGMNWVNYLLERKNSHAQTPDLWKTPHYPFHAVKEGASLFLDYLGGMGLGDEVGLVSYDTSSRVEMVLDDGVSYVNISSDPITSNLSAIDTIQTHKQAGHYSGSTGMGYGIRDARELLVGADNDPSDLGYARYGARPSMLVMTDGQTNQAPGGWSLPGGFDWAEWTDYDKDGAADYSTSNRQKQYAFWQATESVKKDITIHTMSVGLGADRDLMEAIAYAGKGVWIDVPGGATVQEMESQLRAAFAQIAETTPPPRLGREASDGTSGDTDSGTDTGTSGGTEGTTGGSVGNGGSGNNGNGGSGNNGNGGSGNNGNGGSGNNGNGGSGNNGNGGSGNNGGGNSGGGGGLCP